MKKNEVKEVQAESMGKIWADRIRVLLISAVLASIANWIYGWRMHAATVYLPWQVWGALLYMIVIVVVSCVVHDLLAKVLPFKVPVILYIALFTTILSFPAMGWLASTMAAEFGKIGLLPLCTPVLAYAGVAAGKDLDTFKKQGVAIICVAIITFIGTYVGSALIAEIVLKATNVI